MPRPERPPGWDKGEKEGWDNGVPPGQEEPDMALTISIEGLGVLDNAEAVTNFGISGSGGASFELDNEIYFQGAGSIATAISSGKYGYLYYDHGSFMDFTPSTGSEADQLIYIWCQVTTPGAMSSLATPGFSVRIGKSLLTYREYDIAGYDDLNGWDGGWRCIVIDPTVTGSRDVLAYLASEIQYIGIYYDGNTSSRSNNVFIDTIAVGSGIRAIGTETTTGEGIKEIVDYCTDRVTRAWGMIQEREGIYYLYGKLFIGGDASEVTLVTDGGRVLQWGNSEFYGSGAAWITSMKSGRNGLIIEDHASYITTFQDGILVGSDQGRSGCVFIGHPDIDTEFDLFGGLNTASITKLYGSQLKNINKTPISWGDDGNHHCYSVSFERCGTFDPVGAVIIRNCNFINCKPAQGALKWNADIDIEKCVFVANADGAASAIDHWAAGVFTYTALTFADNWVDLYIPGSLGTLVYDYSPTSDADLDIYSGSVTRVSQQFTGTAGQLTHAAFSTRKQGSPTGNVYVKLYADSGGAPTGAALATSKPVDIATLDDTFFLIGQDWEFYDEFTLVAATEYHISIEYTGGDSSNRLEVEYLAAGDAGETCNTYVSSWSSQTYDCRFFVNKDGYIKILATGSNPSTYRMQTQPMGAINIVNSVNLTITVTDGDGVEIQDAQTSIYTDDASKTELMNEDTNVSGVAQAGYNYLADQDIVVKVRKASGAGNYVNYSTRGKIEAGGYSLLVTLTDDPNNTT